MRAYSLTEFSSSGVADATALGIDPDALPDRLRVRDRDETMPWTRTELTVGEGIYHADDGFGPVLTIMRR